MANRIHTRVMAVGEYFFSRTHALLSAFLLLFLAGSLRANALAPASDTLRITLPDAEKRFVDNNLSLLAQKFNISAAKAFQVQAGLWDNPSISLEQNVYNPANKKYFPTGAGEKANGANGENIVQINQLFLMAGKRNKRVGLEKINVEIAEYSFYDLMRTLRLQLRTDFFSMFFLQQSLRVYDTEIASLEKTVGLYQDQYTKGNIALKELTRLKSFLFTLENDRKNLRNDITEHQANLLLLLSDTTNAYIVPQVDKADIDKLNTDQLNVASLIEMARTNRYDLKAYEAGTRYEKQNLAYQKALAVPDVRLGGVYDRNGSYIPNYYAVNLQMDLPVFNRNQGNIQAAKSRAQASVLNYQNYQLQVEKDVLQAYNKSREADQLYKRFDASFISEFNQLIGGIIQSYERKNIGLVEFIDFFESYKNNVLQMNQLQSDRMQSFEEINFATGENIFKY